MKKYKIQINSWKKLKSVNYTCGEQLIKKNRAGIIFHVLIQPLAKNNPQNFPGKIIYSEFPHPVFLFIYIF